MSRTSVIMSKARQMIGDENAQRYSDNRLLILVNDAQKDIVRQANLLQTNTYIPLADNVYEYDLPSDLYFITRAIYRSAAIEFLSHDELDKINGKWEKETTEYDIRALVYDKMNARKIKVYPTPTNIANIQMEELGVAYAQLDTGYTFDVVYGLIATLQGYTFSTDFGIVGQLISDSPDTRIDIVGDFGEIQSIVNYDILGNSLLKIYYVKKPSEIATILDDPEIDDFYDDALSYYVAGMALRDDNDRSNFQRGENYLAQYTRELGNIQNQRSSNFMQTGTVTTIQRSVF